MVFTTNTCRGNTEISRQISQRAVCSVDNDLAFQLWPDLDLDFRQFVSAESLIACNKSLYTTQYRIEAMCGFRWRSWALLHRFVLGTSDSPFSSRIYCTTQLSVWSPWTKASSALSLARHQNYHRLGLCKFYIAFKFLILVLTVSSVRRKLINGEIRILICPIWSIDRSVRRVRALPRAFVTWQA